MITYHALDSITMMKALEIIEKHLWIETTSKQSTNQEVDTMIPSVLTSIRNAMRSSPLNRGGN